MTDSGVLGTGGELSRPEIKNIEIHKMLVSRNVAIIFFMIKIMFYPAKFLKELCRIIL